MPNRESAPIMDLDNDKCIVCKKANLTEFSLFRELKQVTSDCKPWSSGGRLAICSKCSTIQKIIDPYFLKNISEIYSQYDMFHQSEGIEQSVFSSTTGSFEKRSSSLCKYIESNLNLSDSGALLDVGCATGETLRAFNLARNDWELFGHDLGRKYFEKLQKIPNFKALFSGDFLSIEGTYDLITLIHTLEHFLDPIDGLKQLSRYIKDKGYLFIQIPNAQINPFDLLIADHVCHFSTKSFKTLVESSGYEVHKISDSFIDKEITALIYPSLTPSLDRNPSSDSAASKEKLLQQLMWLEELKNEALTLSKTEKPFGIFGTSISGTWLGFTLEENFDFFVDEDPARIGQEHMGKPILSPEQIPENSHLYVPLIPLIAERISRKLTSTRYSIHCPKSFELIKNCA